MSLAIVDIGVGNIGSVAIAFERLGVAPLITADPAAIRGAARVVLPGVGAAGFAMAALETRGLVPVIRALARPVLGICLGMQLLFDRSEEGDTPCLGLIPGSVRTLSPAPARPVPHMGWSRVATRAPDCGLVDGDYLYFAHSFAADDGPWTLAAADYGRPIPALVRTANFTGAQFHPERSGAAGARFLERWLAS